MIKQLYNKITGLFHVEEAQPVHTKSAIKRMAIHILETRGSITNRDLVNITNGQTWVTSDLRRDGYIAGKFCDTWEVGKSGKKFKRYYWTGKKIA